MAECKVRVRHGGNRGGADPHRPPRPPAARKKHDPRDPPDRSEVEGRRAKWDEARRCGLTEAQRKLVGDNLGLIGVHLRRVRGLDRSLRRREREDLFQEGCLGLMRAAVSYREDMGVAFRDYAIRRIHHAVSNALETKFILFPDPPPRGAGRFLNASESSSRLKRKPRQYSLSTSGVSGLLEERKDPALTPFPTVGERIREKYERVVRRECDRARRRDGVKGDRSRLIECLLEERLLIPDEVWRRPLRTIARELQSSFTRVAKSEAVLIRRIRHVLNGDPEFVEMRRVVDGHISRADAPIQESLSSRLADRSAEAFVDLVRTASTRERGERLRRLWEVAPLGFARRIAEQVRSLTAAERDELWLGELSEEIEGISNEICDTGEACFQRRDLAETE